MQLIIKKLRIFGEKRTKQKMKRKWKNGERIKQKISKSQKVQLLTNSYSRQNNIKGKKRTLRKYTNEYN